VNLLHGLPEPGSTMKILNTILRNLGDFLYWHTMTADEKYIMLIGALVSKPECIENDDGTTTRIFRSAGKEETP